MRGFNVDPKFNTQHLRSALNFKPLIGKTDRLPSIFDRLIRFYLRKLKKGNI